MRLFLWDEGWRCRGRRSNEGGVCRRTGGGKVAVDLLKIRRLFEGRKRKVSGGTSEKSSQGPAKVSGRRRGKVSCRGGKTGENPKRLFERGLTGRLGRPKKKKEMVVQEIVTPVTSGDGSSQVGKEKR